jgi:hypothetical protein
MGDAHRDLSRAQAMGAMRATTNAARPPSWGSSRSAITSGLSDTRKCSAVVRNHATRGTGG